MCQTLRLAVILPAGVTGYSRLGRGRLARSRSAQTVHGQAHVFRRNQVTVARTVSLC